MSFREKVANTVNEIGNEVKLYKYYIPKEKNK